MGAFEKWFATALHNNIGSIGKTVLILDSWETVMDTLRRIWVVWEVYSTVDTGANFEVLFKDNEKVRFLEETFLKSDVIEKVIATLSDIKVEKAVSANENDRKMILGVMKDAGTTQQVNQQVVVRMCNWLADTGCAYYHLDKSKGSSRAVLCNNLSLLLRKTVGSDLIVPLLMEAVAEAQKVNGEMDLLTLTCMHNLAKSLTDRSEQERLLSICVDGRGDILGKRHKYTLSSKMALAQVRFPSQQDEAIQMMEEVVRSGIETYSGHDDYVIEWMRDLAFYLRNIGRLRQAEDMYRRLLDIVGVDLGTPRAVVCKNGLATTLQQRAEDSAPGAPDKQRLYDEAEELFRDAYNGAIKFSDEGSRPLSQDSNLAGLLKSRGKIDESEQLYVQVLRDARSSGVHVSDLTQYIWCLANVYSLQKRMAEAIPLYEEVVEISMREYPQGHPRRWDARYRLGNCHLEQGCLHRAESELLKARAELRIPFSDCNFAFDLTLLQVVLQYQGGWIMLNGLGVVQLYLDQSDAAEAGFREAFAVLVDRALDSSLDGLITKGNIASALRNQGRLAEAELLQDDVVQQCRDTLGPTHQVTLLAVQNSAKIAYCKCQYDEAEALNREVVKCFQGDSQGEDPFCLRAMQSLAIILSDVARWEESEALFCHVHEARRNCGTPLHEILETEFGYALLLCYYQERFDEAREVCNQEHVTSSLSFIYGCDHRRSTEGARLMIEKLFCRHPGLVQVDEELVNIAKYLRGF